MRGHSGTVHLFNNPGMLYCENREKNRKPRQNQKGTNSLNGGETADSATVVGLRGKMRLGTFLFRLMLGVKGLKYENKTEGSISRNTNGEGIF